MTDLVVPPSQQPIPVTIVDGVVSPPKPTTALELIDGAAKLVAIVIATGLLLGMIFNIMFFFTSQSEWLFHLSVADNISAAFYAIPFAVVMLVAESLIAASSWWLLARFVPAAMKSLASEKSRNFAVFKSPIMFFGYLLALMMLISPVWLVIPFVSGVRGLMLGYLLLGCAVGLASLKIWFSLSPWRNLAFAVLVVLPLISGAAILGWHVKKGETPVEIELANPPTARALIRGKTVRSLEGGLILQQACRWIWLPRTEIRRITELPYDHAGPSRSWWSRVSDPFDLWSTRRSEECPR